MSKELAQPTSPSTWQRYWPWLKRLISVVFLLLVIYLMVALAKRMNWPEVWHTLHNYQSSTLWWAAAATVASFVVYSYFDVLGRAYAKHALPVTQILPVTFVCYAFNLNLSSWVGGIALRYRLYSRLGLSNGTITQILALSMATNWIGYMFLAGVLFASGSVELPPGWKIGTDSLRVIGVLLVLASVAYGLFCTFAKKRSWQVRGRTFALPSGRMALLQIVIGALNWALMAAVMWVLLLEKVDYPTVLGVLLIASIAGVITHIPAGLGVLETIFLTLLRDDIGKGMILAALIGYRILYFLAPLVVATLVYLVLELRAKQLKRHNGQRPAAAEAVRH